jgi:hypothetical protein
MTDASFKLPSGAVVHVESTHRTPAGFGEVSGVGKARETWMEGVELVSELAGVVVDRLKETTSAAKEVAVEFGVSFSGKTGIILVEGTASANMKVTIKW